MQKQHINYDPKFDFLKGIAIFFVLLEHSILREDLDLINSWFYIGQAVPLFLLIQAYHSTRKLENISFRNYYSIKSLKKVFNRVILPFIVLQGIIILILYFTGQLNIKNLYFRGGYGPGSYYPFIYAQAWIILPLLVFILNKMKLQFSVIFIIIISILSELIYIIWDPQLVPYRLYVGRYIFLLFLGCIWRKIDIPGFIYPLSIISIILVSLEFHNIFSDSIFVYETIWKGFHWWAYFYSLAFLSTLLYIYKQIQSLHAMPFINKLGKASYEIFLVQMFIFGFNQCNTVVNIAPDSPYIETAITCIFFVLNIALSISGGLLLHKLLDRNKKHTID
jgi:peptidoglycan/LPS O-acetylase OafA/YrhL